MNRSLPVFRDSVGQVAIVDLPGAGTLPAASDPASRVPGTADGLSGGSVGNASDTAANRPVVFRYS